MAGTFELPCPLADVMLLVGMDDNTNLMPVNKPENGVFDRLFSLEYDPQVLSAISATNMQHFFPFHHIDAHYPPEYGRDSQEMFSSNDSGQHRDRSHGSAAKNKIKQKKPYRSVSAYPKMMRNVSYRHPPNKDAPEPLPELPISEEVLRSIPALCFPDGMRVHRIPPPCTTHYLVLTDMSGHRTYTTCLTFYRAFLIEKDDQDNIYMSLSAGLELVYSREEGKVLCYVPHCCVTISQHPYYTKMKECLSSMLSRIDRDPEEMVVFLKEYAHIMTHTPVPPPGNVAVVNSLYYAVNSFSPGDDLSRDLQMKYILIRQLIMSCLIRELNLYQLPLTLMPSPHPDRPVIDFPMHFVFLCFPTEELLKLLSSVLVEERMVFLSNNYALLTIVMETIRNLILPFKWRFTYVTVLPSNGLGYLQAPGTFMFGCHSRHRHEVMQVEGLVVADIDAGRVSRTEEDPHPRDGSSGHAHLGVPELPREAARVFAAKCHNFRFQYEMNEARTPFCYSMDKLMKERARKTAQLNAAITYAGLELMVNLFRGVVYKLSVEHGHFNRKEFLNQQTDEDKPFFERVVVTDMFKVFLVERTAEKTDYWYDQEMKTRGYGGSQSTQSTSGKRMLRRQSTISQSHVEEVPEPTHFLLPDVTHTQYLANCVEALTKAIKDSPDYDNRTSYHYLRALFHIASGNKMAAVDDFIDLSTTNLRILPVELLVELRDRLSHTELVDFSNRPGAPLLLDLIDDQTLGEVSGDHGNRKVRMDPLTIPQRDLKYDEFVEYVTLMEMTNDHNTIDQLFLALTNGQKQMFVDQVTFAEFAARWEENAIVCSQTKVAELGEHENILKVTFTEFAARWEENAIVCSQIKVAELGEHENILKVSRMIKSNLGIGRLVLTDKRLFFLSDVSNRFTEVVKLRNISKLVKSQHVSFLNSVDILQIVYTDKTEEEKQFVAFLEDERNWWHLVVTEMRAGKVIAEATKDIMATQQAMQNTLLIDTLIASGQHEEVVHHNNVEWAAAQLAFYSGRMEANDYQLPPDTLEALIYKVDPNVNERGRKTVQALLYTGGEHGYKSPKLWCGLSDGKIKVYNAISWVMESEFVQAKQCVACLTAVGDSQVWAGSFSIHIIDCETITCNKTLMEHRDLVVDIVVYNDNSGSYVFTGSLDGTIIKWNLQKLTFAQPKIELTNIKSLRSLRIYKDKMLCGTWSSILMCDLRGNKLNSFSVEEGGRAQELDSFAILTNGQGQELDSFTILTNGQIWAGSRREGRVFVWDTNNGNLIKSLSLQHGKGISSIIQVDDRVWVGTKSGMINIFSVVTQKLWKELKGHDDAVRVLCGITDRYIVTGGGSKDGKVCIWSSLSNTTDSGHFYEK